MEDVASAPERTLTQKHGDGDETQERESEREREREKYLWICSRCTEEEQD